MSRRAAPTTRPAIGAISPASALSRVDLPAPFGPMTAVISPSANAPSSAWTTASPA